jgi:hypothetical protein
VITPILARDEIRETAIKKDFLGIKISKRSEFQRADYDQSVVNNDYENKEAPQLICM